MPKYSFKAAADWVELTLKTVFDSHIDGSDPALKHPAIDVTFDDSVALLGEDNVQGAIENIDATSDVMVQLWQAVEAVSAEHAIIRGSTTLTGADLTNYTASFLADAPVLSTNPQLITLDIVAGTITAGYAGLYRITAYVAQTGGNNSAAYVWTVNASGAGGFVIGTEVFSNATSGAIFSASTVISLAAGEVLTIRTVDTITGIIVGGSDFEVKLLKAD